MLVARVLRCAKVGLPPGPGLSHFISQSVTNVTPTPTEPHPLPPYLTADATARPGRVWIETYGCQMNVSDTEIVKGVLFSSGYEEARDAQDADVILLNTCAIRENAETKVWRRLVELRAIAKSRKSVNPMTVGVLGCMAERLKQQMLEREALIDLVAGPDAYRDLPNLIRACRPTANPSDSTKSSNHAINVQLSADETYADIAPVRSSDNGVGAYVSIMRGCNNMCAFCIVPFTRGRERSRDMASIVAECERLAQQGYREITLLGQNVNSYCDETTLTSYPNPLPTSPHFTTVYKPNTRPAVRFTELLDQISVAVPNVRIRFTSPHPKDFPDGLLQLMAQRHNICKQVHLPAQSGSTSVLERMRRGYTREAYLALAHRVRDLVPGVALSSDFISGFCGETEEDHQDTLSLLTQVKYEQAFMFAYSMRERTHAHRRLQDDVPEGVKQRRLREVIDTFHATALAVNQSEIGRTHLVLVDKTSRKSEQELAGRTSANKKVVFPKAVLPCIGEEGVREVGIGDWVAVTIEASSSSTLRGVARFRTTTLVEPTVGEWATSASFEGVARAQIRL